jgi:polyisoprenoid-binding protein YceI
MQRRKSVRVAVLLLSLAWLASAAAAVPVAKHWQVLPASTLSFIGMQAGANFEGVFRKFTADIHFDPTQLAESRFDVGIDLSAVSTRDAERDGILQSVELFNVKQFPQAHYVATQFKALGGNRYSATGQLTLRSLTRSVPLEFTYDPKFTYDPRADAAVLEGTAHLKRLDFGVGQGDWQSTEWVGNDVQVKFSLQLRAARE